MAALNQSPIVAAAAPFVRVLAEMFGPDPHDVRAGPAVAAAPRDVRRAGARASSRRTAAKVRVNALARVVVEHGRVAAVDVRGERIARQPRHRRRAVVRAADAVRRGAATRSWRRSLAAASRMDVEADRDGQPLVRPAVMDDAFVGLAGPRDAVGLRQAAGVRRRGVAPVARLERRDALTALSRDELIALAAREVAEAIPARARRRADARDRGPREARDVLARAGQPARPAASTPVHGLFLAGDWIDTGLPGTIESAVVSGHRAAER